MIIIFKYMRLNRMRLHHTNIVWTSFRTLTFAPHKYCLDFISYAYVCDTRISFTNVYLKIDN